MVTSQVDLDGAATGDQERPAAIAADIEVVAVGPSRVGTVNRHLADRTGKAANVAFAGVAEGAAVGDRDRPAAIPAGREATAAGPGRVGAGDLHDARRAGLQADEAGA